MGYLTLKMFATADINVLLILKSNIYLVGVMMNSTMSCIHIQPIRGRKIQPRAISLHILKL